MTIHSFFEHYIEAKWPRHLDDFIGCSEYNHTIGDACSC